MAPKKITDVQVIDLGSHVIKAAAITTRAGKAALERAGCIVLKDSFSDVTRYFNDVRAAVDGLANSGTLDRKTPLFFLVGESMMPISIAYLNNQNVAGLEMAMEDSLNKFVASEGTTSMEVTLKKSFKLREKPQGADVQVVAAHAYVKYDVLKELQEICVSRKIPFGGAYPKIFSYQELFKQAFGGDAQIYGAIACMIDIGYNSTNMVAFKEGRIVFHKSLHIGGRDYFNELRNLSAEKNFFQLTFPQFTDYMAKVGMTGEAERIGGLGMPISNPAAYAELTHNVTEELATKVRLSLDYFSTVSATDFNTSMATVMAVRKGAEHIYITGGLVATDGFSELAHEQLTESVQVLDPIQAVASKVETPPSPFHYVVAIGGGLVALSEESDDYNMGLMLEGTSSAAAAATAQGVLEQVPQWAHAILLVVLLAVGYEWWSAHSACNKIIEERKAAAAELSKSGELYPLWVDGRVDTATDLAKLDFFKDALSARPPWTRIFREITEAAMGLVKVGRFQCSESYPHYNATRTPDGTTVGKREPPKLTFKISGEAKARDDVYNFSRKLGETGNFADFEQPQLVNASGGGNPFNPEQGNIQTEAQFYFQVTGNIVNPQTQKPPK